VASVSVSASPGQPGNLVSTTFYDYDGGLYDAAAREFRGFAGVTETRPDGRVTVRVFQQTDALSGKLASETVFDAEGRPWFGVDYGYVADATAPYVGLVARVDRHEYDGQATPRQSRTEYRYDGGGAIVYGNPSAIIEWGEITGAATDAVPGDTRTTELSYLPNAALHLVDRVKTRMTGGTRRGRRGAQSRARPTATRATPRRRSVITCRTTFADAAMSGSTTTSGTTPRQSRRSQIRWRMQEQAAAPTTEHDTITASGRDGERTPIAARSPTRHRRAARCVQRRQGLVGQQRGPNDSPHTSWARCCDVFGRTASEADRADSRGRRGAISTRRWPSRRSSRASRRRPQCA
jgi:hypothetical protein